MSESRGRKKENTEVIKVRTQEIMDSVGGKMVYKFDYNKFPNGAYSVEFIPTKHQTTKPVFDLNQRTYSKAPNKTIYIYIYIYIYVCCCCGCSCCICIGYTSPIYIGMEVCINSAEI